MYVTYRIITTRRRAIRQRLPDELVEPFFLLAVTVTIIGVVGAHEAGYDEGHSDAYVRAWLGRMVCLCEESGSFYLFCCCWLNLDMDGEYSREKEKIGWFVCCMLYVVCCIWGTKMAALR